MTRADDLVTDHAVVRYLERVYGVDVVGIKARILRATEEARLKGAGGVTCDGTRYVLNNGGRVVTITAPHGGRKTKRARRWRARHAKNAKR